MREKAGNLPYIIIYLIGTVFLFLTAIFYRQPLLSVFLILLFIIPPVCIYLTIKALPSLHVELKPELIEYGVSDECRLILEVKNPSFLPLLNCRLFFRIMNMYHPDDTGRELLFSAEAKCDKKIYVPVKLVQAGMLKLRVEKLRVSDPLHMYTKTFEIDTVLEIPVMPQTRDLSQRKFNKSESMDEDSIWAPDGDLTRDLREIREYRAGDRLKDIHWLLAARMEELPVKEFERAKELYFLLLPELREEDLQETLETFYSLAKALQEAGEIYRVAVYQAHDDIVVLRIVDNEESLKEVMYMLFREPVGPETYANKRLKAMYPEARGVIRVRGTEIEEV